tara:strand:- start:361 stop:960 length:600 start_codon:yes stop_codon:yes gene_type:complete
MADPAYLVDGVLTEGDPYVCLASQTMTDDTVSDFTWNSGTGDKDWSQYQAFFIVWQARTLRSGVEYDNCLFRVDANQNNNYGQNFYTSTSSANPYNYAFAGLDGGYFNTAEDAVATNFSCGVFHLFAPASGKWKTGVYQNTGFSTDISASYSSWGNSTYNGNSDAMSSLKVLTPNSTFKTGSRFDLFGILPKMALTGIL